MKNKQPLAQFEQDLVLRLIEHSRRIGIDIELCSEATSVEGAADGSVAVQVKDGGEFAAGIAVQGSGRVPNLDQLDLAVGKIDTEKGRLKLDRHLRSISKPLVFAAGDAAAHGPALTPIASLDADCITKNLLEGCVHEPDYSGFASVVFAIPPLAMVGLTEAKAHEQGLEIEVHARDMNDYQSVRREGHEKASAAFKILIDRQTHRVLGAHIFGPDAHEVINLFALTVRLGLRAEDLGKLLSAYPSASSNIASMLS